MRRFVFRDQGESGGGAGDKPDTAAELAAAKADLQKLRDAEAARVAAATKAEEEAAKKRGEFEALHKAEKERADTAAAKLAEFEAKETARAEKLDAANKARVAKIPEAMRSLVPASLTGDALADYLDANAAHLFGTDVAAGTRTAGGTKKGEPSAAELAKLEPEARKRGMDAKTWHAVLVKAGRIKPPTAEA